MGQTIAGTSFMTPNGPSHLAGTHTLFMGMLSHQENLKISTLTIHLTKPKYFMRSLLLYPKKWYTLLFLNPHPGVSLLICISLEI